MYKNSKEENKLSGGKSGVIFNYLLYLKQKVSTILKIITTESQHFKTLIGLFMNAKHRSTSTHLPGSVDTITGSYRLL